MSANRIALPSALAAVLALAAGPAPAQAKKDSPEKENLDALLKVVEAAQKAKDYRSDPRHGNGTNPYEEIPAKPALLIGFEVYPGVRDKTVQYVRGVRPLFQLADNKKLTGTLHGWVGSGAVRVEAKPGYAVAGLKVHTDFGEIAGLAVVFARITPTGLDMDDSYDSKYYGHNDPNTARKVVCTGEPIMGIHGLVAANAKSNDFGLGLVVLGKDPKKKK